MGRTVSLVLVAPAGQLLGMLPPLELACPFWPESADVVAEVEARFRAHVVVLRLLRSDALGGAGGEVSYLAELEAGTPSVELLPVPEQLRGRAQECSPKRMPWAERGEPPGALPGRGTCSSRAAIAHSRPCSSGPGTYPLFGA